MNGGEPQPGVDYESALGTLVFPPGTTNQTIPITILSDTLNEGPEHLIVNLINPVQAVVLEGVATLAIADNDPEPELTLNNVTVQEGDDETVTTARFDFFLSTNSGRDVTVDYSVQGVTATPNKDFIPALGTLTFLAAIQRCKVIWLIPPAFAAWRVDNSFMMHTYITDIHLCQAKRC